MFTSEAWIVGVTLRSDELRRYRRFFERKEPTVKVSALLVVPLLATGGIVLWQRGHGTPLRQTPHADEIKELRNEVGRLEAQVRTSSALVNAAVGAASSSMARSATIADERDTDRPSAAAPEDRPQISNEQVKERIQQRFDKEAKDPAWSPSAQSVARSQVTQGLPRDSRIEAIECSQSMCRAKLTHRDLAAFQEHMTASLLQNSQRAWNGNFMGTVVKTASDGSVDVELYLFRSGEDPVAEVYAQNGTGENP